MGQVAGIKRGIANVRFGPEADIDCVAANVSFRPGE